VEAVAVHTLKTAFIIGKNGEQEPIFAIGSKPVLKKASPVVA